MVLRGQESNLPLCVAYETTEPPLLYPRDKKQTMTNDCGGEIRTRINSFTRRVLFGPLSYAAKKIDGMGEIRTLT